MIRRFDVASQYVIWLPDNRRLLYFTLAGDELIVLDIDTGQARRGRRPAAPPQWRRCDCAGAGRPDAVLRRPPRGSGHLDRGTASGAVTG
jgi:hypothetical protein